MKAEFYHRYSEFLKARFGGPVRKICVDAGFSCPNRDGALSRDGCVFCDNDAFGPPRGSAMKSVREQVLDGIAGMEKPDLRGKYLVYFQPFSNTHGPVRTLRERYEQAFCHPDVVGLAIGTRPDCLDPEKAALLREMAERAYVSVEIGVQSLDEDTLRWMNRGHSYGAVEKAVALFHGSKVEICLHLILGFPSDSRKAVIRAARALTELGYHSIKIHSLHVCKGTRLEGLYWDRLVPLFTLNAYVSRVADFLEHTPWKIVIQRIMGEAQKGCLVAPEWCATKSAVIAALDQEFSKRNSRQGAKAP